MGLRPIPAVLQTPAVDDVADKIDRVGVIMLEKIEQQFGLTTARAEMKSDKNSVR